MITDWGAHHLDIAHWALDMDRSGPARVIPPSDWNTAQYGARLVYPNGVEVTHISNNGVTFFGDNGEIYVNRGKIKLTVNSKIEASFINKEDRPSLAEQLDGLEKRFLTDAKVRLYQSTDHKEDFLLSMVSRKQPIADVETGSRTVIGCHLLGFAYYHGKELKWNPAANEFLGDTGDAKWLRREYRGPWKLS